MTNKVLVHHLLVLLPLGRLGRPLEDRRHRLPPRARDPHHLSLPLRVTGLRQRLLPWQHPQGLRPDRPVVCVHWRRAAAALRGRGAAGRRERLEDVQPLLVLCTRPLPQPQSSPGIRVRQSCMAVAREARWNKGVVGQGGGKERTGDGHLLGLQVVSARACGQACPLSQGAGRHAGKAGAPPPLPPPRARRRPAAGLV